jgi:glycosyltransferase involved in cell wall biosynthesis
LLVKISVALCTHNGASFVGQQLMGLRWQTKPPYEVIVVDADSTDRTVEIVNAYADQVPYPVRIVRNTAPFGLIKNYEHAIRLCTGEAIALCHQDDLWQPDKLRKLARVLEREPGVGGVFSDGSLIDEHSRELSGSLWQRLGFTLRQQTAFNRNPALNILLQKNVVTVSTLLFRYRFVEQITPIAPEWSLAAWIAVLVAAQSHLVAVPDALISYRVHPTRQVGKAVSPWQETIRGDADRTVSAQDLMSVRWSVMAAKLAGLRIDPAYLQLVQKKASFLKTRSKLREQGLLGRFAGATAELPAYLRFSPGLSTYLRDLKGTGFDWDVATEVNAAAGSAINMW